MRKVRLSDGFIYYLTQIKGADYISTKSGKMICKIPDYLKIVETIDTGDVPSNVPLLITDKDGGEHLAKLVQGVWYILDGYGNKIALRPSSQIIVNWKPIDLQNGEKNVSNS